MDKGDRRQIRGNQGKKKQLRARRDFITERGTNQAERRN
jgi:hypothetical protein